MQLCEPITATVIFPFVFRLVNETGVTKGNEDRTGYYSGIIVCYFLLDFHSTALRLIWTGINVLPRRDSLHPTMGETIRQDRPQTSRVNRTVGPHALDDLFWAFADLPHSRRQPGSCWSAERKRRRLKIRPGRDYRRHQRGTGFCLATNRRERRVDYRACSFSQTW